MASSRTLLVVVLELILMATPNAFPTLPVFVAWGMYAVAAGILLWLGACFVARKRGWPAQISLGGNALSIPILLAIFVAVAVSTTTGAVWYVTERDGVTNTSTQPIITIIPPAHRYKIIWIGGNFLQPRFEPEDRSKSTGEPLAFRFVTENKTSVSDISIIWRADVSGIGAILENSHRLSNYEVVGNESVSTVITRKGEFPYPGGQQASKSATVLVPFITGVHPGTRVDLPPQIFANSMLYILALLPDETGARMKLFDYTVLVKWNLPTPGQQEFIVKSTAINVKPAGLDKPIIEALISFKAEKTEWR